MDDNVDAVGDGGGYVGVNRQYELIRAVAYNSGLWVHVYFWLLPWLKVLDSAMASEIVRSLDHFCMFYFDPPLVLHLLPRQSDDGRQASDGKHAT